MPAQITLTGSRVAANPQDIQFARFEGVTLTVTMSPTTDITAWTLLFSLRVIGSSVSLTKAGVITNPAASGIFTVTLTSAETGALTAKKYDFDIWRTDSGSEARLVLGVADVKAQAWQT